MLILDTPLHDSQSSKSSDHDNTSSPTHSINYTSNSPIQQQQQTAQHCHYDEEALGDESLNSYDVEGTS